MPQGQSAPPATKHRRFVVRHCERCHFERIFVRPRPDHRLHLILTIFTLGLWSVGWAAVALAERRDPWRCTICGSRYVPPSPVPPTPPSPPKRPRPTRAGA